MLALPQATGAELLVEGMVPPGGLELIVAARSDAVVPSLVIGLGGIWTEALADAAIVPLPASPERVERPFAPCVARRSFDGDRGTPAVDIAALATAASRIGELMLERA